MSQNKQTQQESFVISGKAFWDCTRKVNTLSKKYQLDLSVDEETAQSLEEMGIVVNHAKKEEDQRGKYVILKSTFPVKVVDSEVQETDVTIGNRSTVNVTAHVYNWRFQKKSGVALGLDAVQIIDLVEFQQSTKTDLFTKQPGFTSGED